MTSWLIFCRLLALFSFSVLFFIFSLGQALFPIHMDVPKLDSEKVGNYIRERCSQLIPEECNPLLVAHLIHSFVQVI
jgi:hypothetical protein